MEVRDAQSNCRCRFAVAANHCHRTARRAHPGRSGSAAPIAIIAIRDRGRSAQLLADLADQFVLVRKRARLELGIDQLPVERHFKASPTGRLQLEAFDLLFVAGEQFRRQTDGLRLVVSHRAVTEMDLHRYGPLVP